MTQPDPAALAQLERRLLEKADYVDTWTFVTEYHREEVSELLREAATALDQHAATARALEDAVRVVISKCKRCGEEWPHWSILSSFPICLPCAMKAEADREAHTEALKAMTAERDEALAEFKVMHRTACEESENAEKAEEALKAKDDAICRRLRVAVMDDPDSPDTLEDIIDQIAFDNKQWHAAMVAIKEAESWPPLSYPSMHDRMAFASLLNRAKRAESQVAALTAEIPADYVGTVADYLRDTLAQLEAVRDESERRFQALTACADKLAIALPSPPGTEDAK